MEIKTFTKLFIVLFEGKIRLDNVDSARIFSYVASKIVKQSL